MYRIEAIAMVITEEEVNKQRRQLFFELFHIEYFHTLEHAGWKQWLIFRPITPYGLALRHGTTLDCVLFLKKEKCDFSSYLRMMELPPPDDKWDIPCSVSECWILPSCKTWMCRKTRAKKQKLLQLITAPDLCHCFGCRLKPEAFAELDAWHQKWFGTTESADENE